MSAYFAFRFKESKKDNRECLAIFFSAPISPSLITKVIKQDVTENLAPYKVYLIGLEERLDDFSQYLGDQSFKSEFDAYVGDIDSKLVFVIADRRGKLTNISREAFPDDLTKTIFHNGMLVLFKKHKGMVVSNHGYHFVKPSGDHCDKFIRASNLLVSGVEVTFLALSLLPHLRHDIQRIYVDTSSISFLVSLAIQIHKNFDCGMPSIESFASYAVLDEQFDFVEDRSSLVLISATTSGSLAKKLSRKKAFGPDQIVTLFHVNLPSDQTGIFDISSAVNGRLTSSKVESCEFCKRQSKLIRIAGEQFLPENPKHELLVIRKSDFDGKRQDFFKQFASRNLLHWNVAVNAAADLKEHFYIDVEKAVENVDDPFYSTLQKNIRRYVTRDLMSIVCFDDPGSTAIVQKIREYLKEDFENVTLIKNSELSEEALKSKASVLVVAGAITSGRSLLAVSRKLRCLDQAATINYLVAFSKLPNEDANKQLKTDLEQGGHSLVVLQQCSIPRVKEYTKTAWDYEREKLKPFSDEDPFGELEVKLPSILLSRRQIVIDDCGDVNSLFLPNAEGKPLTLRRTFAFWSDLGFDDERLKAVNQSDVYWTIQVVLHDLRNASQNNGLATPYHTTLISPANFDRYNDGVIQACFLRAALPIEMDYRVDEVFSRRMTDIVMSILINWENDQGEAALEFLMAIWSLRMRLLDQHLQEIVGLKGATLSDDMNFLLDRINELQETST